CQRWKRRGQQDGHDQRADEHPLPPMVIWQVHLIHDWCGTRTTPWQPNAMAKTPSRRRDTRLPPKAHGYGDQAPSGRRTPDFQQRGAVANLALSIGAPANTTIRRMKLL